MFADPIQITYNSVTKDLVRVNQDANGSDYYLDDGEQKFSVHIRHTIPPRGGSGESHMLRLDVEHFDSDGIYIRQESVWTVIKTFDNTQNAVEAGYAANALEGILTSGNISKLIQREN